MEKFGYNYVRFTSSIWEHKTNDTIFALVIDIFCVKYTSESNTEYSLNSPRKKYSITVDRKAENL